MVYVNDKNSHFRYPNRPLNFSEQFILTRIFSSVAQWPNMGVGSLIVEVSRSHIVRHTRPVRILWTGDQLVLEAATHKTHNKRTSMPSAGFEPTIPETQQLQTYALDRRATEVADMKNTQYKLHILRQMR